MAKIHLSRLIKKYDFTEDQVSGSNYRELMTEVLNQNSRNAAKAIGRLSNEHWEKQNKRLRKGKQVVLPDLSEVFPKASVSMNKSAEQGMLISDTLRDELNKKLRDTLNSFKTEVTDEQAFIRRRGTMAGTINPKVINRFQKEIEATFVGYTKKDPRFGVPSNIRTIAVTEIRTVVDEMKWSYMNELLKKNPGAKMEKEWLQNKRMSKKPRRAHGEVNGHRIPLKEKFEVPLYDPKEIYMLGITYMDGPHDKNAPLEQKIGCNCELKYYMVTV